MKRFKKFELMVTADGKETLQKFTQSILQNAQNKAFWLRGEMFVQEDDEGVEEFYDRTPSSATPIRC